MHASTRAHARKYTHARKHTRAHTHTHTHARAHTHTHTFHNHIIVSRICIVQASAYILADVCRTPRTHTHTRCLERERPVADCDSEYTQGNSLHSSFPFVTTGSHSSHLDDQCPPSTVHMTHTTTTHSQAVHCGLSTKHCPQQVFHVTLKNIYSQPKHSSNSPLVVSTPAKDTTRRVTRLAGSSSGDRITLKALYS